MSRPRVRPASLLRSVLGYALFITSLVLFLWGTLLFAPGQVVRPLKPLLRLMFRAFGWRVRVVGLEHLPTDRAHLFMCNHVSILDPFLLLAHFPGYFVGLEKAEAARIPLYGRAARRWGQIPIDRADRAAALAACEVVKDRLAHGVRVTIFPEGTRTRDGRLAPFKKGGFHIGVDSQAEVVPVVIEGLYPLAPRGSVVYDAGDVTIHVFPPIPPPPPGPAAYASFEASVRAAMLQVLERSASPRVTGL